MNQLFPCLLSSRRLMLLYLVSCVFGILANSSFAQSIRYSGTDDEVVKEINRLIRQGWQDNEVKPSKTAGDAEWLRRATLDIQGHIPKGSEIEAFLSDKDKEKRRQALIRLIDSPDYMHHMTTVWSNLLIGRINSPFINPAMLRKFLRESFATNRPWNDIVYDLVTAEGHMDESGAANYLLAQLEDDQMNVQATAKTTRLFLGIQVQCTQCHNHPFNDWQQSQFWEFNSFMRQARRIQVRRRDPITERVIESYGELRNQNNIEPNVFFEKRNGLMQVAYPAYFGKPADLSGDNNRRIVFGNILHEDEDKHLARAFVNRMWAQFFGYGFTRPVDDIGPHNPPSHPELLEFLTDKFVSSGYNVKQLMLWITSSEAYQLDSNYSKSNEIDNPAAGETPLFSRMYIKAMTAEQVYDSMLVASQPDDSASLNLEQVQADRNRWLQQFVSTFGTDENDEATTFNGTIPQALMMMNGELINLALAENQTNKLKSILSNAGSSQDAIVKLYLTVLSRNPTRSELNQLKPLMNQHANPRNAMEDLYWALLNSNEFQFVY